MYTRKVISLYQIIFSLKRHQKQLQRFFMVLYMYIMFCAFVHTRMTNDFLHFKYIIQAERAS